MIQHCSVNLVPVTNRRNWSRLIDSRMGVHRRRGVARPVEDQASGEQNPQQDGPDEHGASLP